MSFRIALAGFASLFLATAATAEVLECKIAVNESSAGYITEIYYFESDPETGKALAHDGLTEHFEGGPVAAKIVDDSKKKKVFSWSVAVTSSKGQNAKLLFRASYFKDKKTVLITAAVGGGYDGGFEGRGTCKEI
jgi:hypothetical protein